MLPPFLNFVAVAGSMRLEVITANAKSVLHTTGQPFPSFMRGCPLLLSENQVQLFLWSEDGRWCVSFVEGNLMETQPGSDDVPNLLTLS